MKSKIALAFIAGVLCSPLITTLSQAFMLGVRGQLKEERAKQQKLASVTQLIQES